MAKKKKEKGEKQGTFNVNYVIGLIGAIVVCAFGMVSKVTLDPEFDIQIQFGWLIRFFDPASIFITIGCTVFVIISSFPGSMLKEIPRHLKIITSSGRFNPIGYIDQLEELAQAARKEGLLSLENRAGQLEDPFFRSAVMLVVDAYDADKIRSILETDIDNMSARHESVAAMYDKAASVAPAFGMVGTLVGLINMLKSMNLSGDSQSTLGSDMGTALITTLYGCIMAHMIFSPIATLLRARDEEEVLCKVIIIEGVMSIQAGENPKFLRERLMTYVSQADREGSEEGGKKKKKGKKSKKSDQE